jgi:hypothetical protein
MDRLLLLLIIIITMPCSTTSHQPASATVSLMNRKQLGDFESDGWEGYACTFAAWTSCVNTSSSSSCSGGGLAPSCAECAIKCATSAAGQRQFHFPRGGIFPVVEQFELPINTAIIGASNPNQASDLSVQQVSIQSQTWFIVPRDNALCGTDPMCNQPPATAKTACVGDPHTHRQGFLMSTNSTLKNINFQGADLGRAGSEGTLCGPGAIELPGCLSGEGCAGWGSGMTSGSGGGGGGSAGGVVANVLIENVRLSDAVRRADIAQMDGNCRTGEALDGAGQHVHAHQVSVWVAKLPNSEQKKHENVRIKNLVSMNSR